MNVDIIQKIPCYKCNKFCNKIIYSYDVDKNEIIIQPCVHCIYKQKYQNVSNKLQRQISLLRRMKKEKYLKGIFELSTKVYTEEITQQKIKLKSLENFERFVFEKECFYELENLIYQNNLN